MRRKGRKVIKPAGSELMDYLNKGYAICNKCGAVMDRKEDPEGGCDIYACPSCGWEIEEMVNPGSFTVEEIPGTKRSLVRLYQNVEACKIAKDAEDKEGLDGFQYDEYCVEVESWPGLAASVRENYDTYLAKGKDNEVDRSNDALFRAQKNTDSIVQDTDAMSVDHEYRLTLLELGLSE